MQKKLTITMDEELYHRLHSQVGRGRISQFIEAAVRPHLLEPNLLTAYQQMAQDEEREAEALEWVEAVVGDAGDETR